MLFLTGHCAYVFFESRSFELILEKAQSVYMYHGYLGYTRTTKDIPNLPTLDFGNEFRDHFYTLKGGC